MKDHLSVSQMDLYMACSLKYKFTYIDELPKPFKPAALAFGGAVHSVIEWFNKGRASGQTFKEQELIDIFEADWWAANTGILLYKNGDTKNTLLELGMSLIALYFKESQKADIVGVEQPFEVLLIDPETLEKLELPLVGRFDLVEKGPVIVDLKTAGRKWTQEDVDMNLQLTGYSFAYYLKNERIPDLRLDVLLKYKTPRMERMLTSRSVNDFRKFFYLAKQVVKGVKSEVFLPQKSWRCTDCEFRQQCWLFSGVPN